MTFLILATVLVLAIALLYLAREITNVKTQTIARIVILSVLILWLIGIVQVPYRH